MAFPKTMYNSFYIPNGITNKVGEVIEVQGSETTEMSRAVHQIQGAPLAGGVLEIINMAINLTKDLMGATDASLGEVRPENTSAIMALQKGGGSSA